MEGEIYYRDLGLPEPPVREDPRIFLSKWILTWLFMDCKKALYPDLDASKAKLAKPRDPASATILSLSEAPLLSQDTQNSISQESWGKGLFTKKNSLLPTSIPSPTSLALPTSLYDFEETPFIQLPKGMQIIISVGDAVSYLDTFRWAVETSECEIEHVPMWIYNWILMVEIALFRSRLLQKRLLN